MRKTRTLIIAMCALVLALGVNATYAWLTDVTGVVTNTFTVGKVEIALDESATDEYGEVISGIKDGTAGKEGNSYKLIPGHTYVKDPTVHVLPGSEKCWLFVQVVNGVSDIEDADEAIAKQIVVTNGWVELEGVSGVYYKIAGANESDAAVDYPVFGSFTIDESVEADRLEATEVTVKAYAVQYEGFEPDGSGDEAEKTAATIAWVEASE